MSCIGSITHLLRTEDPKEVDHHGRCETQERRREDRSQIVQTLGTLSVRPELSTVVGGSLPLDGRTRTLRVSESTPSLTTRRGTVSYRTYKGFIRSLGLFWKSPVVDVGKFLKETEGVQVPTSL